MVLALLPVALAVNGVLVTAAMAVPVGVLTHAIVLWIPAREALTELLRHVVTRAGAGT